MRDTPVHRNRHRSLDHSADCHRNCCEPRATTKSGAAGDWTHRSGYARSVLSTARPADASMPGFASPRCLWLCRLVRGHPSIQFDHPRGPGRLRHVRCVRPSMFAHHRQLELFARQSHQRPAVRRGRQPSNRSQSPAIGCARPPRLSMANPPGAGSPTAPAFDSTADRPPVVGQQRHRHRSNLSRLITRLPPRPHQCSTWILLDGASIRPGHHHRHLTRRGRLLSSRTGRRRLDRCFRRTVSIAPQAAWPIKTESIMLDACAPHAGQ